MTTLQQSLCIVLGALVRIEAKQVGFAWVLMHIYQHISMMAEVIG